MNWNAEMYTKICKQIAWMSIVFYFLLCFSAVTQADNQGDCPIESSKNGISDFKACVLSNYSWNECSQCEGKSGKVFSASQAANPHPSESVFAEASSGHDEPELGGGVWTPSAAEILWKTLGVGGI